MLAAQLLLYPVSSTMNVAIWSPPRAFAGIVDDFAPRHDLPKASCADAQPSSSPSFQNRPSLLVCRIAAIGGPGSAGHEALGLGDLARCSSRYCGTICFLPLSKCAQDCHVKIDDIRQAGQLLKRPSCVKKSNRDPLSHKLPSSNSKSMREPIECLRSHRGWGMNSLYRRIAFTRSA